MQKKVFFCHKSKSREKNLFWSLCSYFCKNNKTKISVFFWLSWGGIWKKQSLNTYSKIQIPYFYFLTAQIFVSNRGHFPRNFWPQKLWNFFSPERVPYQWKKIKNLVLVSCANFPMSFCFYYFLPLTILLFLKSQNSKMKNTNKKKLQAQKLFHNWLVSSLRVIKKMSLKKRFSIDCNYLQVGLNFFCFFSFYDFEHCSKYYFILFDTK